jgi:hypothetical protein
MASLWRRQQLRKTQHIVVTKSPWRAVSVVAKGKACSSALALKGVRTLCREASRLPLSDCTNPDTCICVFRKFDDRRAGPRRNEDETGPRKYVQPPNDKRAKRGRRKSDYSD